jgi:phosphoserine phosphatase RsbU/P
MGSTLSLPLTLTLLFLALLVSSLVLRHRYRSRRVLVERIAWMESLSSAGQALVGAQLDVRETCLLAAREAGRVIDTTTFQIGLFEGDSYTIQLWRIDGQERPTPQTFQLHEGGGLIGWVRDQGRALLVRDFAREMDRLPAQPSYVSSDPPRAAIFVPLVSGSRAIGVIAAQSRRPGAFDKHDLSRMKILANQTAAAITYARSLERERRRATHLDLVGQIGRQINAINELDELLTVVVNSTCATFSFSSVNVFGVDVGSGELVMQASSAVAVDPNGVRIKMGHGLVGTAAATRRTSLANETKDDHRFLAFGLSQQTRSEICVPLVVDDELLGVLDVQSDSPRAFEEQEQRVLEALGAQVAIAIHKAQQLAAQREQAWVTTARLQVAEALGEVADLSDLSEVLVRLTALLAGVDSCALLLWNEEMQWYLPAAAYGLPQATEDAFGQEPLAVGRWAALDAVHVGAQPLTTTQPAPWDSAKSQPTSLILPLMAGGRPVGALLTRPGSDTLSGARLELLRSIGAQAAQAIDNLNLQMAQQEEAWVNTALLQVAEAVNRLTDLNEILSTIVRMVPMLVGVKSCIVLIWDEDSESYRAGPSHGLSEMAHGVLDSFEIDLSEFPLVEKQDMERVGPEAVYATFALTGWMRTVMDSERAHAFPLYARAKLVGVLLVGPTMNGRPLSGRRQNIVSGIAQQAAVAVANDRLYRESAERDRLEQELDLARSIQASLLPETAPPIPGCSVASLWQSARQVGGDFYDFLRFDDGRWAIVIADVADKGVPAALFMAVCRTVVRTIGFSRQAPAQTLRRSNRLIYADTSSNLFVTVFFAVWDHHSSELRYASAGHNPAVLVRANGQVSALETDGVALGVLEEAVIEERSVRLQPGDVVVFYTDGITEAVNEDMDEFGFERLSLVVAQARKLDADGIRTVVSEAVREHTGETSPYDDSTLVILKRCSEEDDDCGAC